MLYGEQLALISELQPEEIVRQSIWLLKEFEAVALKRHPYGYVVGYSGGKDSDVLIDIFKRAGVKFFVMHNHTTLDDPETVYYVRRKFAEFEAQGIPCKIYYPDLNFWALCRKKLLLPTRYKRFCCSELKEANTPELQFATMSFGVRKQESPARSNNRDSIEMRNNFSKRPQKFRWDDSENVLQTGSCYTQNYFIVNPLAYWSTSLIWDYIQGNALKINPLYAQGCSRVGCICCPMSTAQCRREDLKRNLGYKKLFVRLCDYILAARKEIKQRLLVRYKDGEEFFDHWISDDFCRCENPDQIAIEEANGE